jgi:hypothetical protein
MRHALMLAQPRLGDARPVTLTPSSPKRGASWARMMVMLSSFAGPVEVGAVQLGH